MCCGHATDCVCRAAFSGARSDSYHSTEYEFTDLSKRARPLYSRAPPAGLSGPPCGRPMAASFRRTSAACGPIGLALQGRRATGASTGAPRAPLLYWRTHRLCWCSGELTSTSTSAPLLVPPYGPSFNTRRSNTSALTLVQQRSTVLVV
jgi:hypothetical protein